jgi:hypothetical protein
MEKINACVKRNNTSTNKINNNNKLVPVLKRYIKCTTQKNINLSW